MLSSYRMYIICKEVRYADSTAHLWVDSLSEAIVLVKQGHEVHPVTYSYYRSGGYTTHVENALAVN